MLWGQLMFPGVCVSAVVGSLFCLAVGMHSPWAEALGLEPSRISQMEAIPVWASAPPANLMGLGVSPVDLSVFGKYSALGGFICILLVTSTGIKFA